MTSFQIVTALAILFSFLLRRYFIKKLADDMPLRVAPFMIGMWIVVVSILLVPLMPEKLFIEGVFFLYRPELWSISFLKGVMLWLIFRLEVGIKRESASSGAFMSPVGNGAIAIGNTFLGEVLTNTQLFSVLSVGVLGSIFMLYGHAQELTRKAKLSFVAGIFVIMFLGATDYHVISQSNWYLHIMMSGFGACFMALLQKTTRAEFLMCFNSKKAILAGVSIVFAEFILLSSMVTVMPVSLSVLFAGLSVPIFMVMSSFLWGERSWKEQGLFGLAAFILTLPIILGG